MREVVSGLNSGPGLPGRSEVSHRQMPRARGPGHHQTSPPGAPIWCYPPPTPKLKHLLAGNQAYWPGGGAGVSHTPLSCPRGKWHQGPMWACHHARGQALAGVHRLEAAVLSGSRLACPLGSQCAVQRERARGEGKRSRPAGVERRSPSVLVVGQGLTPSSPPSLRKKNLLLVCPCGAG